MTDKCREVLEAALNLSPQERIELAEELFESVPLDEEVAFDEQALHDAWAAELDRRAAEDVPGIPWKDVKDLQ